MQGWIQEIVKGDPVYPVSKGYVCRVNMRRAKRTENYPLAVGVENVCFWEHWEIHSGDII